MRIIQKVRIFIKALLNPSENFHDLCIVRANQEIITNLLIKSLEYEKPRESDEFKYANELMNESITLFKKWGWPVEHMQRDLSL